MSLLLNNDEKNREFNRSVQQHRHEPRGRVLDAVKRAIERLIMLKKLYETGLTLEQIGKAQNPPISRQRVATLIARTNS